MLALLGALGLALSPVNTTQKPVEPQTVQLADTPSTDPAWKEKIDEIVNKLGISNIVNYSLDAAALTGLVICFAKYRSAKAKTTKEAIDEFAKTMGNEELAKVRNYMEEQVNKKMEEIMAKDELLQDQMNVLIKCFVLAQDKSPEGRSALLNYIDTKVKETADKAVKEVIEEQKDNANKDIEKEEEVIDKLNEEDDEEHTPVD